MNWEDHKIEQHKAPEQKYPLPPLIENVPKTYENWARMTIASNIRHAMSIGYTNTTWTMPYHENTNEVLDSIVNELNSMGYKCSWSFCRILIDWSSR